MLLVFNMTGNKMESLEVAEPPNQSEPNWYSRIYQTLYGRRMLILAICGAICGVLVILFLILGTTDRSWSSMEVAAKDNIINGPTFVAEGCLNLSLYLNSIFIIYRTKNTPFY